MSKDPSTAWKTRNKRWRRFVQGAVKAMEAGTAIPIGPSPTPLMPPVTPPATASPAKIMVCAPHPDDESLLGALPLRLRLETGAQVTDCAITLGSNRGQRPRRLRELESACRVLGYDLIVPLHPAGFDNVNLETRRNRPREWAEKVETLRGIFDRALPDVVFAPHSEDGNTTHIGTHYLAVDALGAHLEGTGRGPLPFVEMEYWHQLSLPNLMVGVTPEVEAILLMATAEHGGEVSRNPYHFRHPGRMMDNVRRGSEVVGGQGAAAQPFLFAELYRVTFMVEKEIIAPRPDGRIVGPTEKIDAAWLTEQFWPQGS